MVQLHYNLQFRWFVCLSSDYQILNPTLFIMNTERHLNDQVMGRYNEKLKVASEIKALLSD